jgi:hypothetical protein
MAATKAMPKARLFHVLLIAESSRGSWSCVFGYADPLGVIAILDAVAPLDRAMMSAKCVSAQTNDAPSPLLLSLE